MTWVYLDDKWDVGRKMLKAMAKVGDAASTMWTRGITQCNRDLSDGRIDGDVLRSKTMHRNPQAVVDALVAAELLHLVGDDVYEFHDFLDWNDSRAEVEAKRERKRAAASIGGHASARQRGAKRQASSFVAGSELANQNSTSGQAPCLDSGSPTANQKATSPGLSPSPSPSPSGSSNQIDPPVGPPSGDAPKPDRSKRGTRCPASTAPDAPAWLEREGLPALGSDHGAEVAKMLDHFAAAPGAKGVKLDWPATWRNWAKSGFSKVAGPAPGHRRQNAPQRQPDAPPPSPLMALAADLDGPVARSREEVLAIVASGTLRTEEVT